MRIQEFQVWLSKMGELSLSQRQQAVERLGRKPTPADVIGTFTGPSPICPHCHSQRCAHWGSAHGLPRYRCGGCGKTFNALTGTPLARLRCREHWPEYAKALINGDTVRAATRRCGVHTCAEPVEARTPRSVGVTGS